MKVVNKNGYEIDFDLSLMFMDDEIKEKVAKVIPNECTEQGFFTLYEEEYEKATGKEWFLSKRNPAI